MWTKMSKVHFWKIKFDNQIIIIVSSKYLAPLESVAPHVAGKTVMTENNREE